MNTCAVIPVKAFDNAKQRLAPVLSSEERQALSYAMLEDVLTAVEACALIDEMVIVTNDPKAADMAAHFQARTLAEPSRPGLIAAVTEAAESLEAAGVERMVFLPGDVPMVTPEELEIVLDGFVPSEAGLSIVPASDLGGTNCLLASPPTLIPFQFGVDSFRKHLSAAHDVGIEATVLKLPGLGLDIDTPPDLKALMTRLAFQGVGSHTYRYGTAIELNRRLETVEGE